ncbi:MAG: PIN domain-containing protein [Leptospiraceae bacterium]|nr:PIN domain-containing protein [Leptospiraceae bacterium]
MGLIVDTNALSDFAAGAAGIKAALLATDAIYLPVIVLGEYRFGLLQSRDRKKRMAWLADLERIWNILPVTEKTAVYYAEIRNNLKKAGKPIPSNDLWIAALALESRLAVLTRDKHFASISTLKTIAW